MGRYATELGWVGCGAIGVGVAFGLFVLAAAGMGLLMLVATRRTNQ